MADDSLRGGRRAPRRGCQSDTYLGPLRRWTVGSARLGSDRDWQWWRRIENLFGLLQLTQYSLSASVEPCLAV